MYRGLGFEPIVDKDGRMHKILIRKHGGSHLRGVFS